MTWAPNRCDTGGPPAATGRWTDAGGSGAVGRRAAVVVAVDAVSLDVAGPPAAAALAAAAVSVATVSADAAVVGIGGTAAVSSSCDRGCDDYGDDDGTTRRTTKSCGASVSTAVDRQPGQ